MYSTTNTLLITVHYETIPIFKNAVVINEDAFYLKSQIILYHIQTLHQKELSLS